MGLYLALFEDEEEIDGVEVGSYADFGQFRDLIVEKLERGRPGSRFPTLILHSDCDGEWSSDAAKVLEAELAEIEHELPSIPPIELSGWKADIAKLLGIRPTNLLESFFDVDGEPLIERLIGLAQLSKDRRLPIIFQ